MRDTQTAVAISDTSSKADQVYFERLAAMTPAERTRLGVELWQAAQALQWSAARRRLPQADEAEIAFHVAVTRFGAGLARAAYRKA